MSAADDTRRAHPDAKRTIRNVTLAAYVVAALAWIYGVVDNDDVQSHLGPIPVLTATVVLYALFGAGIGSWWALLLPFATVVLALPAGSNRELGGDLTLVVLAPIFLLPVALPAVAAGVGAAKLLARRARRGGAA